MDAIVYIYIIILLLLQKRRTVNGGRVDHVVHLLCAFSWRSAYESEKRILFFSFPGPPPIPTRKQGNSGRLSKFLPPDFLQLVN